VAWKLSEIQPFSPRGILDVPRDSHQEITCLIRLAAVSRTSEALLRGARRSLGDSGLRKLLGRCALQRATFARELEEVIRREGGVLEGKVERRIALLNLSSKVREWQHDLAEDALFCECLRGEVEVTAEYGRALSAPLPEGVEGIVERQCRIVSSTFEEFEAIAERMGAASLQAG